MERYAEISACSRYRYWLARVWASGPVFTLCMLNPSTADAEAEDPTIRKCIEFAKRNGCGALSVVNLFAGRATQPADLFKMEDPVGPENDAYVRDALRAAGPKVAAWGVRSIQHEAHAVYQRTRFIKQLGIPLLQLGGTKDGHPRHPLYLPYTSELHPTTFS